MTPEWTPPPCLMGHTGTRWLTRMWWWTQRRTWSCRESPPPCPGCGPILMKNPTFRLWLLPAAVPTVLSMGIVKQPDTVTHYRLARPGRKAHPSCCSSGSSLLPALHADYSIIWLVSTGEPTLAPLALVSVSGTNIPSPLEDSTWIHLLVNYDLLNPPTHWAVSWPWCEERLGSSNEHVTPAMSWQALCGPDLSPRVNPGLWGLATGPTSLKLSLENISNTCIHWNPEKLLWRQSYAWAYWGANIFTGDSACIITSFL